jgi:colanic acid biosynthesis glycosyl transferase WcaI
MKVLLVNQYFWPDLAATAQLLADLAADLVEHGFEVSALAGRGRYVASAGGRPARRETWRGVEIMRVGSTEFGRGRVLGRLADYGSFFFGAAFRLAFGPKVDVVVCLSTPPLLALLGYLARLRGARFVYKVEDLYPDVAVALGTLAPRGFVTRLTGALSRRVLARADLVVALDGAMAASLRARGARRVEVIPNWADGEAIRPAAASEQRLRAEWGIGDREIVVLYSGNLGLAHRFDAVCAAAHRLADAQVPVRWVFVGDGPRLGEVKAATAGLPTVSFLPYQARESLGELYAAADLHLVTLRDEVSGLLVPSKYSAALAAGRPVLLVGGSGTDMHDEITREGVGWALPHDPEVLTASLAAAAADPAGLARSSKAARKLFERQYDRSLATSRWAALLAELGR